MCRRVRRTRSSAMESPKGHDHVGRHFEVKLLLNDNLVQSSASGPISGNWTAASVFDLGAYEYMGVGGYNINDDVIDEFTVSGH